MYFELKYDGRSFVKWMYLFKLLKNYIGFIQKDKSMFYFFENIKKIVYMYFHKVSYKDKL